MKEIIDGYYCIADYCDKELVDGIPPCCECDSCISYDDFCEIQTRFLNN